MSNRVLFVYLNHKPRAKGLAQGRSALVTSKQWLYRCQSNLPVGLPWGLVRTRGWGLG